MVSFTGPPAWDIEQIRQVVYLYCRSMDRMDVELGYSVWHEDGEADYGDAIYKGSGRGFIDFVTATHANLVCQSHQVSNVIIMLDGDRAQAKAMSRRRCV